MDKNTEPLTTGGSGQSGKNMWYIIGGIVLVGLLWWGLSGMFVRSAAERAFEAATGNDLQYGADGTATYSNEEGSVTVGGGTYPSNWPADAPQYPGGSIQYSGSSNPQTGEPGSAVVFQVNGTSQLVAGYYNEKLASEGWTIEGTATVGAATTISASKAGRTFGAYIADVGNGVVSVTAAVSEV
ncbi:MAG: hypothetical protein NUV96_01125 [Candidatus Colwellbacteria bacterium]|nr:hypothetical protein [Candidatus Colwellbacteria bacterium]